MGRRHRACAWRTQVAAHELADLVGGAGAAFAQESDRRHDLPRGAVAALKRVVLDEGSLERVQPDAAVGRHTLDGGDLPTVVQGGQRQARLVRRPPARTVQAPHWPRSQPFFVPVSFRCSRSASRSVVRGSSAGSECVSPLTRSVSASPSGEAMRQLALSSSAGSGRGPSADHDTGRVLTRESACMMPGHGSRHWSYNMSFRAIFARAAPMAVLTSFVSSGGGRTAGIPSASIHSSRVQPVVW